MTVAAVGCRTSLSVQEEPMRPWLQKMALAKVVLVAAGLAGSAARAEPPSGTVPALYPNCPPAPCYQLPPPCEGMGQPGQPVTPGQSDMGAPSTDVASLPSRGGGAGIGSSA